MIPVRWAAYTVAAVTLWCLSITPLSLASALLAGLFFICFVVVCVTYGAFERNTHADQLGGHDAR
ncbi:hypothetical protein PQI51_03380 [Microbacterium esteraromaticum]|uniref:hypothetical protein n=1 Tax=Microbacterium esteraromaticum TaxID=57043 RepID=UPI0030B387D7